MDEPPRAAPERRRPTRRDMREFLPRAAVYLRYLLPLLTGVLLFVMSCFYSVSGIQSGVRLSVSPLRLCFRTLAGARAYLGGASSSAGNWFYGLLAAAAVGAVLFYLLAAALHVFAAVSALRAFAPGRDRETVNRIKLRFKIVFPNRVCLFLSDCLWLLPALFPVVFSAVSARFLLVGGESAFFLLSDPPLVAVGVLTVLTLGLALALPRWERRKRMNLFLLDHSDPAGDAPADGPTGEPAEAPVDAPPDGGNGQAPDDGRPTEQRNP